jgi:hypothetical protein
MLLIVVLAACGPLQGEPATSEPVDTPNAGGAPTDAPTDDATGTGSETDAPTAAAIARLAAQLGLAEADVEVVSAEMTEFSDSCLGLGQANESCLQALTPGWLIMLSAGGQEYEVHTDETGEQVRIAGLPA